ncbi:hypothetical protein [Bradyrhizobium algeriense]|nr:hypothetical protein [Bradyrhizobium algeriense]
MVAITDGGESGLAALNDGTFDLMIVDEAAEATGTSHQTRKS